MLVRLRQFAGPILTRKTFTWQFLPVKSRMYINAFDEQFWIVDLPSLEWLDGAWIEALDHVVGLRVAWAGMNGARCP